MYKKKKAYSLKCVRFSEKGRAAVLGKEPVTAGGSVMGWDERIATTTSKLK